MKEFGAAIQQRYGTFEYTTLVFASPQTTTLLRGAVWWVTYRFGGKRHLERQEIAAHARIEQHLRVPA